LSGCPVVHNERLLSGDPRVPFRDVGGAGPMGLTALPMGPARCSYDTQLTCLAPACHRSGRHEIPYPTHETKST
jgi:hypothetical protein